MKTQVAYKDLQVWQKSMIFADEVIQLLDEMERPRKHYRLFEQLEAAVTSVPMNIAEGKGRNSKKEFVHFLYISRGSLYETLTLLEIFKMRGWLNNENFIELENKSNEIAKMLKGLINAVVFSG
ncbi:MAG: four helix bundle protein [Chloroflexota bacterium]|nr:four helix bundle protein [Chloroflexota bacterium]